MEGWVPIVITASVLLFIYLLPFIIFKLFEVFFSKKTNTNTNNLSNVYWTQYISPIYNLFNKSTKTT
jgi:hypothetical protein